MVGIFVLMYVGTVLGQTPDWFSECVGFGCAAAEYRHQRCEADPTYNALKSCIDKGNYVHVTFKGDGTIEIPSSLSPSKGLILDGSGRKITFTGESIRLHSKSIVYRIKFNSGPDDALKLQGYQNAWIHRCSFSRYGDGLVDITKEYVNVTVSNCRFSKHDKTMLIGANKNDVSDENMRVTIHHNYFTNLNQRMPRVRFATVHVYNNVFKNWGRYAVGSSQNARVLVENNYFGTNETSKADQAHTTMARGDDTSKGYLRASGNYYNQNTPGDTRRPDLVPDMPYQYQMVEANAETRASIIAGAGYDS